MLLSSDSDQRHALAQRAAMLAAMLERSAHADVAAFAQLYDQFAPRVYGLIVGVIRDRGLAEDVLQEVFLEVWTKAATFDRSRGRATAWILTIAHRRAVDVIRSREASRQREHRVGHSLLTDTSESVGEQVQLRAEAVRLHAALAQLTEKERLVLSLAYDEGRSQSQIAALTDTPLGTVKTTTRTALSKLRQLLGAPA